MTDKEAAERFWHFALSVYGRDDARAAFLRLQDRDGADVPMLLWCLWCAADQRGLSRQVMAEATAFSEVWRSATVTPLRTLRRGLKSGIEGVSPPLSEAGRAQIATTEQALERMQMDHLAALPTAATAQDASALIALYADCAGLSLDASDVAIVTQAP